MSPEANAKANFRHLRNSISKEQAMINDLESGHLARHRNVVAPTLTAEVEQELIKPITGQSRLAKGVFTYLLETCICGKRYHMDSERGVVYTKLMDHLDAVEETHWTYNSILILSELLVFSGLLTALLCSLKMDHIKHQRFLRLRMWEYIAMVMVIASGLSVVRFATYVVLWPVNWWWRIHKYVVYFTRQIKGCVDVTLWLCIALAGWYLWFRPRLRHVHGELSAVVAHQVTQHLIALCLGSFLWLFKNVLYLKLEANLHYDQLFWRVRMSVVYLHFLQIMHNRGLLRFLPDSKTKKELMRIVSKPHHQTSLWMKGESIWMLVKEMEIKSVPIWILRRLEEEYLDQALFGRLPGNSHITNVGLYRGRRFTLQEESTRVLS